jgi:hypothetical protein
MIILHKHPLSIVEHSGFRSYSASLQPMFKMVTRNTIKRDILSIYDFEKDKSMQQIDKNRSRISITTDMWTSQNKKRGFMVVTANFIDDLWRLQSRVMRYFYFKSTYSFFLFKLFSSILLTCWHIKYTYLNFLC